MATKHVNVADQHRDIDSLSNGIERIIRIRKEVPEIGWGDFAVLRTGAREVLAIRYERRGNSVAVVHNLSANTCKINLAIGVEGEESQTLVNLLSSDHSVADDRESIAFCWSLTAIGGIGLVG